MAAARASDARRRGHRARWRGRTAPSYSRGSGRRVHEVGPELEPGQEGAGQAGCGAGRGTRRGWRACRRRRSATASCADGQQQGGVLGGGGGLEAQRADAEPLEAARSRCAERRARRGRPRRGPCAARRRAGRSSAPPVTTTMSGRWPALARASAPRSTPIRTGRCSRTKGLMPRSSCSHPWERTATTTGRPAISVAVRGTPVAVQQQVLLAAQELGAVVGEALELRGAGRARAGPSRSATTSSVELAALGDLGCRRRRPRPRRCGARRRP